MGHPITRLVIGLMLFAILGGVALAIPWPVLAGQATHGIGNSYGEYQNYGDPSYYHPGIDIMAPAGTPVYAVKAGYVKAILTTSGAYHWRVAIGDSAGAVRCDGWLYAHLDEYSIPLAEGQWVEQGQYLGNLVAWPNDEFHHLHFVKIRNSGEVWSSNWEFIGNALDELEGIEDTAPPTFGVTMDDQLLAFCRNQSASYFSSTGPISGDVDIICQASDVINRPDWLVAPYRLEYCIAGDSSLPWVNSVCFTGKLDFSNNVSVVYQEDAVFHSRGDYTYRNYYFNLTNTDGDSIIEGGDGLRCWKTAEFHNGQYQVLVRAFDRAGNITIDSMTVAVANFFALTGTITISDGNPELYGTVVTVLPDGASDTTNADGSFALAQIGGGSQLITISRPGYETADTVMVMNQARQLEVVLDPTLLFTRGDFNNDGDINVGDAVAIVNYIFKDGAAPQPLAAGDANSDGLIDVGDAVFIINYLFKNGPPPVSV